MVGVSLSVNIKKSDKNTDINKIDDVLLSHQIDAFAFERSIKSNTSGTDELYFNLVDSLSYNEFKKACSKISSNNDYIQSVIVFGNKNNFKACLVFNPKEIYLKEILVYIVDLGYTPIPASNKKNEKTDKDDGKSSCFKENLLFTCTSISDVFIFFIKGIWHIIKFIIDGIGYSLIFIFKSIYYMFKFEFTLIMIGSIKWN